jgi:hypothetical protein
MLSMTTNRIYGGNGRFGMRKEYSYEHKIKIYSEKEEYQYA